MKELARQTAIATSNIDAQISDIRAQITSAVAAIRAITDSIADLNEAQSSIAAAIEQQTAAVSEISHTTELSSPVRAGSRWPTL